MRKVLEEQKKRVKELVQRSTVYCSIQLESFENKKACCDSAAIALRKLRWPLTAKFALRSQPSTVVLHAGL